MNEISHHLSYKLVATRVGEVVAPGGDKALVDERLSNLHRRLADAQIDVDTLQQTIRDNSPSGEEVPDSEFSESNEPSVVAEGTPPSAGRLPSASTIIIKNNLLPDGARLAFNVGAPHGEKVLRWAEQTGRKEEALTARWESDRGRLSWDYDPRESRSASALMQLILSLALNEPKRLKEKIQGTVYWQAVDGEHAGKNLYEIAHDFATQERT
jgi:hypothetical protein